VATERPAQCLAGCEWLLSEEAPGDADQPGDEIGQLVENLPLRIHVLHVFHVELGDRTCRIQDGFRFGFGDKGGFLHGLGICLFLVMLQRTHGHIGSIQIYQWGNFTMQCDAFDPADKYGMASIT
jgi:hypothetical protein